MVQIELTDEQLEKIRPIVGDEIKEINSLDELVGEKYAFQCARYIYFGRVISVSASHLVLKEAAIVYDTGELDSKRASDIQILPFKTVNLMRQSIESFWKPNWK